MDTDCGWHRQARSFSITTHVCRWWKSMEFSCIHFMTRSDTDHLGSSLLTTNCNTWIAPRIDNDDQEQSYVRVGQGEVSLSRGWGKESAVWEGGAGAIQEFPVQRMCIRKRLLYVMVELPREEEPTSLDRDRKWSRNDHTRQLRNGYQKYSYSFHLTTDRERKISFWTISIREMTIKIDSSLIRSD